MKFGIFTNPASPGVISDGEKLRPIGRNNENYQAIKRQLDSLSRCHDGGNQGTLEWFT